MSDQYQWGTTYGPGSDHPPAVPTIPTSSSRVCSESVLELLAEARGEAEGLFSIDPETVTESAIAIEALANQIIAAARKIQQR